jgi:hypothetical protein
MAMPTLACPRIDGRAVSAGTWLVSSTTCMYRLAVGNVMAQSTSSWEGSS